MLTSSTQKSCANPVGVAYLNKRGGTPVNVQRHGRLQTGYSYGVFSGCPSTLNLHGTNPAHPNAMIDMALSILALIAGGVSLELFTVAPPSPDKSLLTDTQPVGDDFLAGNPS